LKFIRVYLLIALLVLAPTALAGPAPGEEPPVEPSGEDAAVLDPVVAEVVRMLEEGVSSALILEWLDRSGSRPGKLGPDDMIALSRARAPDELVSTLLELSSGKEEPPVAVPVPVEPETPPAAPDQAPLPATGAVPVGFDLDYSPAIVEYNYTPWDLIVYLDGEPLSWLDGWSGQDGKRHDRVYFERKIPAGRHVIRVLQERHEQKSKKKDTWKHEARVFPTPIVLELDTAEMWLVEIYVMESGAVLTSGQMPVSYTIRRGDEIVESKEKMGPSTRRWRNLCEDVATAYPGKKANSAAAGKAMQGCVQWNALWDETEGVPDRATVREQMKPSKFRPRPPGPERAQ
jgi:hypothetical protein